VDSEGWLNAMATTPGAPEATIMASPLSFHGRGIGVVVLHSEAGSGTFSADDLATLTAFAAQGAVAVENARLFAEAGDKAVLEERQRLARELHDSVTQSLYGLTLFTHAATEWAQAGELEQVRFHLERIAATSQQVLKEMRLLVYELRPANLATEGIAGALRHRLEAVEHRAGVDAHLWSELPESLPPALEDALYRVGQEALSNSLKHAKASRVDVWLRSRHGRVELVVQDDGCGFSPEQVREGGGGGMGLITMRERAERVGGRLTVTSSPGEGTTIRLVAPPPVPESSGSSESPASSELHEFDELAANDDSEVS
jgi:signal transduction histidine kinase